MPTPDIAVAGRGWPEYQSHKIVRAARIVDVATEKRPDGLIWFVVDPGNGPKELFRPTEPAMMDRVGFGDYALIYSDGFKSVSPASSFDDGYKLVNGVTVEGEIIINKVTEGGAMITFKTATGDAQYYLRDDDLVRRMARELSKKVEDGPVQLSAHSDDAT